MNECTCSEDLSARRPTYEFPSTTPVQEMRLLLQLRLPRGLWQHILRSAVAASAVSAAADAIVPTAPPQHCTTVGSLRHHQLPSSAMVLLLRKPAGGVYAVCCLLFAVSQLCVGNELAANNISVLAIIWRPLHKWASIIAGGGGGADGVSSPSPLTFSHFSAEWVSSCWRRAKGLPCIILVHFPYAFITDDLLMSLCCWRRGVFSLTFYQRSGVGHK